MANVQADPTDAQLFKIDLPTTATDEQKQLKDRIDGLVEVLKPKKTEAEPKRLIEELKAAAQEGFDGVAGGAADWVAAKRKVEALETQVRSITRPVTPPPTRPPPQNPGAYRVTTPNPADPADKNLSWREIIFNQTGDVIPVPAPQLKLKADIESTMTTLDVIFPREKAETNTPDLPPRMSIEQRRFQEYQTKVLGIAQVGLQTPADPDSARQSLESLQADVLYREGPRVKNTYLRKLGRAALVIAAVGVVAYLVIRNNDAFSILMSAYRNLLPLWVGTMIGAWLSFGIRRPRLAFKDLGALEDDMVDPAIRLVFTGLIATAFYFIFALQMVSVKVGGLNSLDVMGHGSSAFLVGMLLGVSEQALPGALTRRASQFVSEVAGK
jgi:hypothetical protein